MNEPGTGTDARIERPLVIITGLSGAGKSTAMRVFEDLGCYCVDNLPPGLIPVFYNLWQQSNLGAGLSGAAGVVIASDVRSGALFDDFAGTIRALAEQGLHPEIIYLDAATHVLINRFAEVRRSHPLQTGRPVAEAIEEERRRLEPIREIASQILDTSDLDSAGLREALLSIHAGGHPAGTVRLRFVSFGFKYGVPQDADFVFDVRFLPNPFYVSELRGMTGEDDAVRDYVMASPEAGSFFGKLADVVDLTLEPFVKVGKLSLTVAVGCTGGRHRSVAFARGLAEHFAARGLVARALHRDASKPQH
ncbi:MAG TPA: RNase adapter RapZ [Polyangia bacterium]|nr:RNase adapter RapZ [Polyangia bacterium]